MTFEDFMNDVAFNWMHYKEWRYGQALFNTLQRCRGELADELRGSPFDPFYAEGVHNDLVRSAIAWIEMNW